MHSLIFALVGTLSLGSPDSNPEAAPPPTFDLRRQIRVHLGGNLLYFNHYEDWFEDGADENELAVDSFGFNLTPPGFRLGLGYGITDGLVVGAELALGFSNRRFDDGQPIQPDTVWRELDYTLRPYVEYAFIPGGRFRPNLFVQGGVGGRRSVETDAAQSFMFVDHYLSSTIGGGGGVHMFIIPQLSIDLAADVNHYWTHQRIDEDYPLPDSDQYTRSHQQTVVGVQLGLSLWFGVGRRAIGSKERT